MPRRPGARPPGPPSLPQVHLARDGDPSTFAARLRDGTWTRIRPGAAVDPAVLAGPDGPRLLALARIAALAHQLDDDAVVSHVSAALVHGLPVRFTPATTHVIQPGRTRQAASPGVTQRYHGLAPEHATVVNGIRVTTLERTVVDCVMSETAPGGLVVADAALHRGADRARCARMLTSMAGRRGVVRGREVLAFADGGAESAGESLTRAVLLAAGLPAPETQIPVATHLGTFWGDLGWPKFRVLIEYDGRIKYANAPAEVLLAEKRREDALREAGWRVIRVTAEDLEQPELLIRRVLRLLPGVALDPRDLLAG